MGKRVRDCPEPCGCYAEGRNKVNDEMSNFDCAKHAKGRTRVPLADVIVTPQYQDTR